MTKREYEKLYRQARNRFPLVTSDTLRKMGDVYRSAAREAAKTVKNSELNSLSQLTIQSQQQIQRSLEIGATDIATELEERIPDSVSKAYWQTKTSPGYARIDGDYLDDILQDIPTGGKITQAGIRNMFVGVDNRLITSLINRQDQNGYTLNEKIWNAFKTVTLSDGSQVLRPDGVFGDYQYRVTNIIDAGIAQGRSVEKIAADIQLYVSEGREVVFAPGRYGPLKPGVGRLKSKVAGQIDWRALRLVRSELYASLQDVSVQQGLMNPAALNEYNWVKTPGSPIDPSRENTANGKKCIELQADSPYNLNEVPVYNHPNCICHIVSVLRDSREFSRDLKNWVNGEDVPYINNWYNDHYLPAQI